MSSTRRLGTQHRTCVRRDKVAVSFVMAYNSGRHWSVYMHILLTACLTLAPPEPRTDINGDPLPEHALVRLGSTRLDHGSHVYRLAFSPDGKRLVSAGDGGQARFWDVATGREEARYTTKLRVIDAVVFSPDGKELALSGIDPDIHFIDPARLRPIDRFE